jgi:hypothetical protein
MMRQTDEKPSTPAWPIDFPLSRPCEVFGETITRLSVKEPTANQLLKCGIFDDGATGEQLLDMIAELSGLTPASVRMLPGPDMVRLSKQVLTFLS